MEIGLQTGTGLGINLEISGNGNYLIEVAGGRYSVFVPFRVGS